MLPPTVETVGFRTIICMKVIEPFKFADLIKDVYFDCDEITLDEITTLFNVYCEETDNREYVKIANNIFREVGK